MASKSRRARDRRIAEADALVRFGKERSDLSALVSEARENYTSDLVAADAAARSAAHFARASRPEIKRIYDTAAQSLAGARQDVANAGGPVTAIGQGVLAREQAGAKSRLAAARASAEQGIEDRIQAAAAGGVYAKQAAKTKYEDTIGQLRDKLVDLGDREGAYTVSRLGELSESRAKRKAASRNIRLTNRLSQGKTITSGAFAGYTQAELDAMSPERKRQIAQAYQQRGGRSGRGLGGNAPATRAELRGFKGNVAKAVSYAKKYTTNKLPRSVAAQELTEGRAPTQTSPSVPSIEDQLALSVGLDMAFDGHVSRRNARLMKEAGIRVADVPGLVSYTSWLAKQQRGAGGYSKGAGRPD